MPDHQIDYQGSGSTAFGTPPYSKPSPPMNNSPEGAQGSANSKTPQTDAKCRDYSGPLCTIGDVQFIPADFARLLERQLAQSEERVAKAREVIRDYSRSDMDPKDALTKIADALLSSSKTN